MFKSSLILVQIMIYWSNLLLNRNNALFNYVDVPPANIKMVFETNLLRIKF